VPRTRAQLKLPKFQASKEDLVGSTVAEEVQKELRDALGDSPIGAALGAASYLVGLALLKFQIRLYEPPS
jgi:omega-6 fatty acid desaturase / acyl-lipid omega-6 desaturase (Delta-12 desaturase)